MEERKSAEEKQRYEGAGCYMAHCADHMSDDNPDKAAALASQQRGARDTKEQGDLASTGLFKYDSVIDGGLDLANRGWDWAGPGVVRGAKNFFDGGAADSASQWTDPNANKIGEIKGRF